MPLARCFAPCCSFASSVQSVPTGQPKAMIFVRLTTSNRTHEAMRSCGPAPHPGAGYPLRDDGIEDIILRLEMMIEIAPRDAERCRNVCKGGGLVSAFVEHSIRGFDDQFTRFRCRHRYRLHDQGLGQLT